MKEPKVPGRTIPAELKRKLLIEAGHRCAIPTCRSTPLEFAHIIPWADVQEHQFENLIVLCSNCHSRYDQKKEIDCKSMQMYKKNLGILNRRYCEYELRLFQAFASGERRDRHLIVAAGIELLLAYAVKDSILVKLSSAQFAHWSRSEHSEKIPQHHLFYLTDMGVEFIQKYREGQDID